MEIKEIWKDINGYEGHYKISNLGRVKSFKYDKTRGRILKGNIENHGYKMVDFRANSFRKRYLIHRLVAETFIPNPQNYKVVNHIDGNKLNNSLENLEWTTQQYNTIHAFNTGLSDGMNWSKGVNQYTKRGKFVANYSSLSEASQLTGCDVSSISKCCRGIKIQVGGYRWKFTDGNFSDIDPIEYPKIGAPIKTKKEFVKI
ncbi:NUMOD4 domain-containing protein [Streptomyces sp. NPDC057927]